MRAQCKDSPFDLSHAAFRESANYPHLMLPSSTGSRWWRTVLVRLRAALQVAFDIVGNGKLTLDILHLPRADGGHALWMPDVYFLLSHASTFWRYLQQPARFGCCNAMYFGIGWCIKELYIPFPTFLCFSSLRVPLGGPRGWPILSRRFVKSTRCGAA